MPKLLEKEKTLNVIFEFFKQFQNWFGTNPHVPNAKEVERHLTTDFQLFNNGKLAANGSDQYLNRIKKFQSKYSEFKISEPLEEPIIQEHKGVLYYKLDLTTHQGHQKTIYIMGLFWIENDRIQKWIEVSSEQAEGIWDK